MQGQNHIKREILVTAGVVVAEIRTRIFPDVRRSEMATPSCWIKELDVTAMSYYKQRKYLSPWSSPPNAYIHPIAVKFLLYLDPIPSPHSDTRTIAQF